MAQATVEQANRILSQWLTGKPAEVQAQKAAIEYYGNYFRPENLRHSPEMTLVCSRGITHALGELVNGRVARVNERVAAQSRFDCAACSSSRRSRASL
jgi:hypothetical protein